jgi:muramoyltetrapeptide carboxypeptidase LdcA involved in peptidoglycan recycling
MKYSEEEKKEYAQMVLDQCHGTDFPILFNVDIGHTDPSKYFLTVIYFLFAP